MIKRLLVLVLALVLGVLGYLYYQGNPFHKQLDASELVSDEAVFVFETTAPVRVWNQIVAQPIWKRLSDIPSLTRIERQLMALDSLTGQSGKLESSLRGHQFVVSFHPTAKSEFDFLFLVAFDDGKEKDFIETIKGSVGDPEKINQRSYSGVSIFEFSDPQKFDGVVSYAFIENVVVASYNSFLIEEAIRQAQSEQLLNFKSAYKNLYIDRPKVNEELGILRLGSRGFSGFIEGVGRNKNLSFTKDFSQQGISANLILELKDGKIVLEGTTVYEQGKGLDFSGTGAPKKKLFDNYISNRTALYYQYNVNDPAQLVSIQNHTFEQKNTLQGELEKHVLNREFMDNLTGEVGYMILEEMPNLSPDKVLLIKTKELKKQIETLKSFGLEMNQGDSTKVISDFHLEKEIFMINLPEFPAHLFHGQFRGFSNTYVSEYEDMLVMSNNSKAIKLFLDDTYNDNTWGRSLEHQRFLEGTSKAAGFNFVVNLPRFWNTIIQESGPDWQVLFQKYAPQLKSFDFLSLRLQEEDGQQNIQIEIGYNLDPIEAVKDVVLAENLSMRFSENLIYGPKAIENFNDRSTDFLVQDETNRIHFFNDEGERIFERELNGAIVSDLYQIDYYKNGKLQVVFATSEAVYGFDRLGESLPGYPIRIQSGAHISHLNLLDYNNTRDYRFFIGMENGDLYVYDKEGNNLDGWGPRKTSGRLATRPAHHRLSGIGDFMVALNASGDLHLMNRRGELITNGPVQLGTEISTDYVLIQRGGYGDTQLATISETGEMIRVNFKGELTYRNQLLRPDRNTGFHLVKDQSDDQYLYTVHEYNKVSVLNAEQEVLFEKNGVSDKLGFQYFSFGSDKNVFVMIDYVQEFIYLYNLEGDLLNTRPINGSNEIEVKYAGSRNEFNIYAIHQNEFTFYKMPL